tara:strand:+ start:229 stop:780 length:552 start_codon:yes stop_codon:yes gene_type:complete
MNLKKSLPRVALIVFVAVFLVFWGFRMSELNQAAQDHRASDYFPAMSDKVPEATWFAALGLDLVEQERRAMERLGMAPGDTSDRELRIAQFESPKSFAVSDSWLTQVAQTEEIPCLKVKSLMQIAEDDGVITIARATDWMAEVYLSTLRDPQPQSGGDGAQALKDRLNCYPQQTKEAMLDEDN